MSKYCDTTSCIAFDIHQTLRSSANILLEHGGCIDTNDIIQRKLFQTKNETIFPQKTRLEAYINSHINEMQNAKFTEILGHNQNEFKIQTIRISNEHKINHSMVQKILNKMCPNGGKQPSNQRKGQWIPSGPKQFQNVLQNIDKYPYNIPFDINNDMVIKIITVYLTLTKNVPYQ